jgi:hypothetical protein
MTEQLGDYTFLPWLRQGVARSITAGDEDHGVLLRATAKVELTVHSVPETTPPYEGDVTRNVEMYGPGEVIGLESRAIIRTDPRPWTTNAEPNYLPLVEFYEEDFPWRYTPAARSPDGLRIRPWLALVVLEEIDNPATTEFKDAEAVADRPLPFITVRDFGPFPPASELWAWAHVHLNGRFTASPTEMVAADVKAAVARAADALQRNPDIGYSRLVSPRRLKENAAYHAFLVPTFERGRLAGLGIDPDKAPYATSSAWADYTGRELNEPLNVPYYHRWYFRTGGAGDFESLVKLLTWETANPRVGLRDMDVLAPGSNLPGIADTSLGGVLRLGGALRAPVGTLTTGDLGEYKKYDEWAKASWPHPFMERMADLVNLGDAYTHQPAEDALADAGQPPLDDAHVDPLVTAPIYGEWQALRHRLLVDADGNDLPHRDNWVHELNLDPRFRVAAGFGADVVRQHQEEYMEAAWKQVGDVLAHNRKVRVAKTWVEVNGAIHTQAIDPLAQSSPSRLLALTAPVQKRVVNEGVTTHFARQKSLTPPVLTSPPMRRILRPGGPLARRLGLDESPYAAGLVEAVNDEKVMAAPPLPPPSGAATVEGLAEAAAHQATFPPQWLVRLARRAPRWLPWVLLAIALLFLLLALAVPILLVVAVLAALAAVLILVLRRLPTVDIVLGPDLDDPAVVDQLGPSPGFQFGQPPSGNPITNLTGSDNAEASRYKDWLDRWGRFHQAAEEASRVDPPDRLELEQVSATIAESLTPGTTIGNRLIGTSKIAPHVAEHLVTVFDEVRYYPRIDEPMYRPLKDLGDELFVPNLAMVKNNSVVALETNQPFIESYMVGVNSEFSRELLWREYPTDQRGSFFRQFWDVASYYDPNPGDAEAQRERLYDIPMIHGWLPHSKLGAHDNRQPDPSTDKAEIVLVIRGELLKKYPNTVIYAHAAAWEMVDGHIDPSQERFLVPLTSDERVKPPRTKVLTPIYQAKVDPDIYFFGFDLDADTARGETGESDTDDPGWFFVLRERPGEPRFGFDESRAAGEAIITVNDLAWSDTGVAKGASLSATSLSALTLAPATGADSEKEEQHDDDVKVVPAPPSAARWAYLLYQAPVMVAVHAAELLKIPED